MKDDRFHFWSMKIPATPSQKNAMRVWIKTMRKKDPGFRTSPKVWYGANHIRIRVETAVGLVAWIDPNVTGEMDAYRFKRDLLRAMREIFKEERKWGPSTRLSEAIELVEATKLGEMLA